MNCSCLVCLRELELHLLLSEVSANMQGLIFKIDVAPAQSSQLTRADPCVGENQQYVLKLLVGCYIEQPLELPMLERIRALLGGQSGNCHTHVECPFNKLISRSPFQQVSDMAKIGSYCSWPEIDEQLVAQSFNMHWQHVSYWHIASEKLGHPFERAAI